MDVNIPEGFDLQLVASLLAMQPSGEVALWIM